MRSIIRRTRSARWSGLLAAALALAAAPPLAAQGGGDGYLFHQPSVRIGIRGGYALATAGSDIFDEATQNFTLDKSAFSSFTAGAELGFRVGARTELGADVGVSNAVRGSEYRHFVDNNDQPIQQRTSFARVPVTMNLRYYLSPPGRAIGKLAWIPSHFVPWVGGGAGVMWYRFRQEGDFFYTSNNRVYNSAVSSDGVSPAVQGMGGVDVSITPAISLTGDARYLWARAPMGGDFRGYQKIDLSGVSMTLGATIRL